MSSSKHLLNEALAKALANAANPTEGEDDDLIIDAEGNIGKKVYEKKEGENAELQRKFEEEEAKVSMLAEMDDFDESNLPAATSESMLERAKYIPIRLTYEERKGLRLISAAVNVSDYTNTVDIAFKNKARRHQKQLQQIVAFLSSVVAATSHDDGQVVLRDRNFEPYKSLIRKNLEIARRYKITNPEKMRSEYGKLIYLMQDAMSCDVNQLINVNVNKPILTVYALLEKKRGLKLLSDPKILRATQEILPDKNKSRGEIQQMIARKEQAIKSLCSEHRSGTLTPDDIKMCLYSICDNNSFLNSNMLPIEDCIAALKTYFSPDKVESGYSLAILGADGLDESVTEGSRLTHSHAQQYQYVLQSLELWSAIIEDMFRLWLLSEDDLLATAVVGGSSDDDESGVVGLESPYELTNTGQGLQRVQQSPRVYRAMHEMLARTKLRVSNETGAWIGSSVIHLGDKNVPNTLMFIDKYVQVSRILGPLMKTLANLETACAENEGIARYIASSGGMDKIRKDILTDFFRHGFDGSGGDNFFDAGSCIDGRLTSAWNWCSQLPTKEYYPLFKLTGFLSFDGEFDK